MGQWSASHKAQFIITLGDNFYEVGVSSLRDRHWTNTWKRIYTHAGISKLPWYVSLGNHDHVRGHGKFQVNFRNNITRSIYFYDFLDYISIWDHNKTKQTKIQTESIMYITLSLNKLKFYLPWSYKWVAKYQQFDLMSLFLFFDLFKMAWSSIFLCFSQSVPCIIHHARCRQESQILWSKQTFYQCPTCNTCDLCT